MSLRAGWLEMELTPCKEGSRYEKCFVVGYESHISIRKINTPTYAKYMERVSINHALVAEEYNLGGFEFDIFLRCYADFSLHFSKRMLH